MNYNMNEVKIYYYLENKEEFMLEYLIPFIETLGKEYFIDRDWYEGPNFKITIKDLEENDKSAVTRFVDRMKSQFPISMGNLIEEKEKYASASKDLSSLEKRAQTDKIRDHFEVKFNKVDLNYIMSSYNSLEQYELYAKSRFQIQDSNNGFLRYIHSHKENRDVILTNAFICIASLFEGGEQRGYMSYVSHIQGFFSLFRKKGKNLDGKFENIYQELKFKINNFKDTENTIKVWKEQWEKIKDDYYTDFDFDKYKEEGFYNLDNQYENLVSNMKFLEDSEFHNLLLNNKLNELYYTKEMITFRNIVNTFYKILPFIGVSFVEKHLYGYMAYRYIEDYILNDTWKNHLLKLIEDNRGKDEIIF